ncbi:aspartic proteinase nepenthesin-2-like [Cryptomeria japonica]|uniref:aspartic proteinase nepenthesin-2-like n=1 Tax=Cryptomeria japonica TaxID=3369 RepID=UPI0027DA1BAA|nr:aspartic proteinase nepenthesin-2-like [Cryptomeria japonica]
MALETFSLKRRASASSRWEVILCISFGCGNRQQGDFGGAIGLVSVGRGILSLATQLGETIKHKFSYCLVSFEDESSISPLFLGDAMIADLLGKCQSTPFIGVNETNYISNYYYLNLHGINVGRMAIKYPASTFLLEPSGNGGMMIDSQSTLTHLADPVYTPFLGIIKSSVKAKPVNASSTDGTDLYYESTLPISKLPQIVSFCRKCNA